MATVDPNNGTEAPQEPNTGRYVELILAGGTVMIYDRLNPDAWINSTAPVSAADLA
ncbi:DUF7331 family protein [Halogeometricum limi]|uniref:Uncharacterized protein n=1 Tax=Halogeometricum limi TaxID=555875 RepID=A0A1I6IJ74_9EURY|nr:hypothetical protein [Halogeometricum limi]SFR66772.1 hypothetical protein SAMN04488124_3283 [Halogeometricum limi]